MQKKNNVIIEFMSLFQIQLKGEFIFRISLNEKREKENRKNHNHNNNINNIISLNDTFKNKTNKTCAFNKHIILKTDKKNSKALEHIHNIRPGHFEITYSMHSLNRRIFRRGF